MMSKMKEYYNKQQEDDPSIEYHMKYPEKTRFTPTIENWYNKNYSKIKSIKNYIKAEKVECPF